MIELQRRGYEVHYVRTPNGFEGDFHARSARNDYWVGKVNRDLGVRQNGSTLLVQVCAS